MQVRRDLPAPDERRALRVRAGLSQQELAEIVGVTNGAISHWETGNRRPQGDLLDRYVEALNALRKATQDMAA